MVKVGVLALQGDVREHVALLDSVGAEAVEVRRPDQLDDIDALVIPGGESTTIGRLARLYGLLDPLRKHILSGLPTLGTCAGMIVSDRDHLGLLDITTRRNAFGRQLASFEDDIELARWYRAERFPRVSVTRGMIRGRKLLSIAGWPKHGVLWEFTDMPEGEFTFEPRFIEADREENWPGRHVLEYVTHAPHGPHAGRRIWPAV